MRGLLLWQIRTTICFDNFSKTQSFKAFEPVRAIVVRLDSELPLLTEETLSHAENFTNCFVNWVAPGSRLFAELAAHLRIASR